MRSDGGGISALRNRREGVLRGPEQGRARERHSGLLRSYVSRTRNLLQRLSIDDLDRTAPLRDRAVALNLRIIDRNSRVRARPDRPRVIDHEKPSRQSLIERPPPVGRRRLYNLPLEHKRMNLSQIS